MRPLVSGAIFTFLMSAAAAAGANGRYPSAQQLLVDPDDPGRLWLRATYGLATPGQSGAPWGWVCEDAVGYGSREDPMLAMAHGGRLYAGASSGVFVSADGGCTWDWDGSFGNAFVRDIATDGAHTQVVALASTPMDNGDYELVVWRAEGDPPVFTALGPPISRDLLGLTIDVAPSDPNRLYISGAMWPLAASADAGPYTPGDASTRGPNGPAFLLRSRDGGVTWERRRLRGASLYNRPYIAAVHPTNPDVLYVRVQGDDVKAGFVSSQLLYSEDAGDSFREVFRGAADLLGFALSPDASRVYVGLGDSRALGNQRPVDPAALGLYEAAVPDFSFTRVFEGQIGCLTYSGENLYACGGHFSNGFEVGVSTDRGRSFRALLDFGGIAGPLTCPRSSRVNTFCGAAWPAVCDPIGVCASPPTGEVKGSDAGGTYPDDTRPQIDCCGNVSTKSAKGAPPGVGALAVALGVSLAFRRRKRP